MHYLMMISENPSMIAQCDLLVKSIKFFSKNHEIYFSIVLQGNENKLPNKPNTIEKIENKDCKKLFNCNITNYLLNNCEFYFSPQFWNLGMPCRWFVKPKLKNCIMIDVDMLACNDLAPVYGLQNQIYGVKAKKNKEIISENSWRSIGFSDQDIQNYYINFGFVVVPSIYLEKIGIELFENYQKMKKLHSYFAGQIALAYAIKKLNLPMQLLSNKFNYYDLNEFLGREEILFLHLLENKLYYKENIKIENKYLKLVRQIKKEIENSKKMFF
jgi:hypothetical protein